MRKYIQFYLTILSTLGLFIILNKFFYKNTNISDEIAFAKKQLKTNDIKNIPKKQTIFCLVITHKANFLTKAKAINETWGAECDKLYFIAKISNENIVEKSTEYTEPLPILEPKGEYNDSYDLLTKKVYNTLIDLYDRYDSYDWYLKTDDDTYVFMSNLRSFLSDKDPDQPVNYGCNLRFKDNDVTVDYQSGGAGYVLSRESLKRIGQKLTFNYPSCPDTTIEDIDVAECIQNIGITLGVSRDEFNKERFHPFSVVHHMKAVYPDWFYDSYPYTIAEKVCKKSNGVYSAF